MVLPFPGRLLVPGEVLSVDLAGFMPLAFDNGNFVLTLPTTVPLPALPPVRVLRRCRGHLPPPHLHPPAVPHASSPILRLPSRMPLLKFTKTPRFRSKFPSCTPKT